MTREEARIMCSVRRGQDEGRATLRTVEDITTSGIGINLFKRILGNTPFSETWGLILQKGSMCSDAIFLDFSGIPDFHKSKLSMRNL